MKINYALLFYLLTILICFIVEMVNVTSLTLVHQIGLLLLFTLGGFLNGITNKTLRSICWPFFLNVVVSAINILGIEVFDAYNNVIISSGDFFASLQLIQFIGNLYLVVFFEGIEHIDDTLLFLYFVVISFIIPYLGFIIGRFSHTKWHKINHTQVN